MLPISSRYGADQGGARVIVVGLLSLYLCILKSLSSESIWLTGLPVPPCIPAHDTLFWPWRAFFGDFDRPRPLAMTLSISPCRHRAELGVQSTFAGTILTHRILAHTSLFACMLN
jgi:hypothetical protein